MTRIAEPQVRIHTPPAESLRTIGSSAEQAKQRRFQLLANDYMPPERREDPIVQDIHLLSRSTARPEIV
jgi:hypothetical protein